jgi:hypothetical protein
MVFVKLITFYKNIKDNIHTHTYDDGKCETDPRQIDGPRPRN